MDIMQIDACRVARVNENIANLLLAAKFGAPAESDVLARARRIRDICASYDVPVAAAALRFTLRHPAVTAAVVGARTPAEILSDVSCLSADIPAALFRDLAGDHDD
jgi:aryl-alcohol dehydrogenase-like predicted oxidoreductase